MNRLQLLKSLYAFTAFLSDCKHKLSHYANRCYIAGKISGVDPLECKQDFAFIAERVRRMGFISVVPFGMFPASWSYRKIMTYCILELLMCRSVYFQSNWQMSRGCKIEMIFARLFMKNILFESNNYTVAK